MAKTYSVEMIKVVYNDEVVYNGELNYFDGFQLLAEDLMEEECDALDIYDEEPAQEIYNKILAELEENCEYYTKDCIDDDYYIEQEYYASVL